MAAVVIVICPNLRCRKVLQVPEVARGRQVRCGHCGTNFMVPTRQQQNASAAHAASKPAGGNPV